MKFLTSLFLLASLIYSVSAHSSMSYPLPRGHPLNPNAPVKDYNCITAPLNGGVTCAPKPFPCGGYPVDTQFGTVLNAGEIFEVKFYNPGAPNPVPSSNQGRHNGGLCEFALSYDAGQTWTKIATYHKTCPDVFFGWKVKIPENAPSCTKLGQCIFSWSWINAVGNRELYQNCADVKIIGKSTTPLPKIDITKANLPMFPNTITPEGDPANTGNAKGSGPLASDVEANLKPFSTTNTQSIPPPKKPKCVNGAFKCKNSKKSPIYTICKNGKNVTLKCPGTLVCDQKKKKCSYK
ncbi:hypothetical protein Glove_225g55 [Diversispora epigaea]|uniref:Chitin-binding type-4 domain-containing protein n=1 Tax=Diversispora epigaea TaxID=1348612 RepID=A0A397IEN7_9GLOM|nr:hypothetical protein Glove_225g55 [Diversispora epigaea]